MSTVTDLAVPDFNLADYWNIVRKHRRLIALCVGICVAIAIIFSLLSTPVYKATVVLNVEREKTTAMDIGSPSTVYAPYDPEFLPTQTKLMTSREVSERTVQRLRLTENTDFMPKRSGMFRKDARPDTERAAETVQGSIDTTPIRRTNLVELSVVQRTPRLAADIANSVADAYIDWNIESKYLVVGQASRFLTSQIEQLKSEIQQKEQQFQAYSLSKDIVSIDPGSNVTMQKLASFNQDYASAVQDRVAKEARYYELQTAKPESIADNLSNGLVSQLRNDQARLEREYAEKLNLFKPEWPAMLQLKAQIDKGKEHLASVIRETISKARDNAYTDYMTALRREQSLKSVLAGQKSEAMTQNVNAVEYTNLKTEVETKRTLLDSLLKRQAETEVTSRLRGERVSNVRVVDRAIAPTQRFRPSYKRNIAFGLFFGLMLGAGVAILLDYLDRSLRSVEQVEKYLSLPALGVIPSVGTNTSNIYSYGYGALKKKKRASVAAANVVTQIELLPQVHPRSTVAEAYRAFRTSLLLSRAGGLKSIVITSTAPAEGKTATAVNLAVVLAQLGKRVLLVDGDLHKRRVHEIFKVSNRVGLVSVLAENIDPGLATIATSIPKLFIVPAGPSSPNPSALLSSDKMKEFLDYAAHNFDFVIIDGPPVGAVADAILIGYLVDGAVLCVRGGVTVREQVVRVRERLTRSNVRILGVLINNLEEQHSGYYDYYPYAGEGYTEQVGTRTVAG